MSPQDEDRLLHCVVRRVTLRDTDAAGLLHYAAALEWTEACFTEWLKSIGRPVSVMLGSGEGVPVVRADVEYKAPIGVDDMLEMQLATEHIGDKSFSVRLFAVNTLDQKLVLEAHVVHVYTRFARDASSPRPAATSASLPPWLRNALNGSNR